VADLETSYLAVRGALVDAIKTAWSPVKIYFDPFDLPEDYAGGYPVVFIDARITAWENETPKTDEVVIAFDVTGIFANDVTNGNDAGMVANLTAAQAELYGVANMGNYGYLGQMSDAQLLRFDGNKRYGCAFSYQCSLSIDRRIFRATSALVHNATTFAATATA
jgi:hypothetical protein